MVAHIGSALLVFGLCLRLTLAANILAVFSYTFASPYFLVAPYMKALVRNGHQLTIISSTYHLDNIDGVRHIRVPMLDQLMEDLVNVDFVEYFPMNKWNEAIMINHVYYNSSRFILNDAGVKSLLQDSNVHFDMVIVQAGLTDACYGFAQHYKAPLVGLVAYGTSWNIDYLAGNKAPSVFEPISPTGYSLGYSFLDKISNWMFIVEEWLLEQLVFLPSQVQLYKSYFNKSAESLHSIRHNFSLMLINQHFSLGRARSNVPNVIEVAGMHLQQSRVPMAESLQRFVDEAEHGVIYFSMGIEIFSKWLPSKMLETLHQSFSQLRQRVVWKYELETLANKSDNIYISPMLPQQELLAHPKVKLFITHAGLLSIIEAVHYAVPMLCLPLYYDQFTNAQRMKQANVAHIHESNTMTVESITRSIKELIENPQYAHNAKQISMRFRDQPMSPLDTAVWWTEYVLRHKGAAHMRLLEQEMSIVQYYSLDILSVIYGRIGLAVMIFGCIFCKLVFFLWKPLRFT